MDSIEIGVDSNQLIQIENIAAAFKQSLFDRKQIKIPEVPKDSIYYFRSIVDYNQPVDVDYAIGDTTDVDMIQFMKSGESFMSYYDSYVLLVFFSSRRNGRTSFRRN